MTNEKICIDQADVKIDFVSKSTKSILPKIIVTQYVEPPKERTIEYLSTDHITPVRKTSSRKFKQRAKVIKVKLAAVKAFDRVHVSFFFIVTVR